MTNLLNNWWKRFSFTLWQPTDEESHPWIYLSLDGFLYDVRPMYYYPSNDTNRWKCFCVMFGLSKMEITCHIPIWKLPDYVPAGKAMLRTRKIQEEHVTKKV